MKTLLYATILLATISVSATEDPTISSINSNSHNSETLMFDTVELFPTDDAYLQGATKFNTTNIRVEPNNRVGYLKFDLSGVSGTITDIQLQFTIYSDEGSGNIDINKGTSDTWTEANLSSANKPSLGALLGSINKSYVVGATETVNLNSSLSGTGILSLVLTQTSGNDTDFASVENSNTAMRPKLIVTYSTSGGDTQAPSTPVITSSNIGETSVDLNWSATDDTAVTAYTLFQDGVEITGIGNTTSRNITGLNAATTYTFTARAYDAANNESGIGTLNVTTNSSGGGNTNGAWATSGANIYFEGGNVGIGTSTPDEKLAVNGIIHAQEIRVDLTGWPDYVFEKDYKLPTLEEVAQHIEREGHLINIPSAKEIEAKGANLGEMNKLLLEKVEELTLYLIELKHKNEVLSTKLELLLLTKSK